MPFFSGKLIWKLRVLQNLKALERLFVDWGVGGEGWFLMTDRRGSERLLVFRFDSKKRIVASDLLIKNIPILICWFPKWHLCGLTIHKAIYRDFGFPSHRLPIEYNRLWRFLINKAFYSRRLTKKLLDFRLTWMALLRLYALIKVNDGYVGSNLWFHPSW